MPFAAARAAGVFYPQGIPSSIATRTEAGPLLHIAGQTPRDEQGNTVGIGDIVAQTHQVLQRLKLVVESQGGSLSDICRLLIFVSEAAHLPRMMEVRKSYFSEPYPASTAVIAGLANPEWLIEIEATAALPR